MIRGRLPQAASAGAPLPRRPCPLRLLPLGRAGPGPPVVWSALAVRAAERCAGGRPAIVPTAARHRAPPGMPTNAGGAPARCALRAAWWLGTSFGLCFRHARPACLLYTCMEISDPTRHPVADDHALSTRLAAGCGACSSRSSRSWSCGWRAGVQPLWLARRARRSCWPPLASRPRRHRAVHILLVQFAPDRWDPCAMAAGCRGNRPPTWFVTTWPQVWRRCMRANPCGCLPL